MNKNSLSDNKTNQFTVHIIQTEKHLSQKCFDFAECEIDSCILNDRPNVIFTILK